MLRHILVATLSLSPAVALAGSDDVPLPALSPVVRHGQLPPSAVRRHVRWGMPRIRRCYERELGKHPGLAFRLRAHFVIEATGRVHETPTFGVEGLRASRRTPRRAKRPITNAIVAKRIGRCVGQALTKLNFPEVFDLRKDGSHTYGRATTVRYRFRFKPIKRRLHTVAAHDKRLADELPPVPKSTKTWPRRKVQPVLAPPSVPPPSAPPPISGPPPQPVAKPKPPAKRAKPKFKLQRGADPIHGIPQRHKP